MFPVRVFSQTLLWRGDGAVKRRALLPQVRQDTASVVNSVATGWSEQGAGATHFHFTFLHQGSLVQSPENPPSRRHSGLPFFCVPTVLTALCSKHSPLSA